jgi:hypothetical protein
MDMFTEIILLCRKKRKFFFQDGSEGLNIHGEKCGAQNGALGNPVLQNAGCGLSLVDDN